MTDNTGRIVFFSALFIVILYILFGTDFVTTMRSDDSEVNTALRYITEFNSTLPGRLFLGGVIVTLVGSVFLYFAPSSKRFSRKVDKIAAMREIIFWKRVVSSGSIMLIISLVLMLLSQFLT